MKNHLYYSSSKRRTPWDGQDELSPTQKFIKDKYLDNYYSKHHKISDTNEADFLNTLNVCFCKHCGSNKFKKYGYSSNDIQRYKCNDCNKTFNVLTNTIFDNHKISILEWIEYLLNIFGYVSFASTSRNSKTSRSTTKYWLIKLFALLKNYQRDTVLKGTVWIDECYVKDVENVMKREDLLPGGKEILCWHWL